MKCSVAEASLQLDEHHIVVALRNHTKCENHVESVVIPCRVDLYCSRFDNRHEHCSSDSPILALKPKP